MLSSKMLNHSLKLSNKNNSNSLLIIMQMLKKLRMNLLSSSNSNNLQHKAMTLALIQLSWRAFLKKCAEKFLKMKAYATRILEWRANKFKWSLKDNLNKWILLRLLQLYRNQV